MAARGFDIERLENRPSPRMTWEYAPPYPPRSLHRRLAKILNNIESRCGKCPSVNKFHHYGGRGIRSYLTLEELRQLWERDGAETMKQPSIDRKDADGHYTFENCRFIEFADNRKSADHRTTCGRCGVKGDTLKGLCGDCRPARSCKRCGGSVGPRKQICERCRFAVKPCAWCGKPIKRDMTNTCNRINKQWFCSKKEQGSWLGTNFGNGRAA